MASKIGLQSSPGQAPAPGVPLTTPSTSFWKWSQVVKNMAFAEATPQGYNQNRSVAILTGPTACRVQQLYSEAKEKKDRHGRADFLVNHLPCNMGVQVPSLVGEVRPHKLQRK